MRASPRTWPSMRPNLFSVVALASACMPVIYPRGVSDSSRMTHAHDHHGPAEAAQNRVIDPVCGMTVDPHSARHRHQHQGRTYYCCSAGCRTKFAADPGKYLDNDARTTEPEPEGAIYTCPMFGRDLCLLSAPSAL